MSQNVRIAGVDYPAVPSVTIPKTGGGNASFTDVSDTTAIASDVASGKYFYTASGVKTEGTSSGGGGGGEITQDANGYLVLSPTGGGGGGGSLTKLGTLTISASPSVIILGGIWDTSNGMKTNPGIGYASTQIDLYVAEGDTSAKFVLMDSLVPVTGHTTLSGSISKSGTYQFVMTGDASLTYYN